MNAIACAAFMLLPVLDGAELSARGLVTDRTPAELRAIMAACLALASVAVRTGDPQAAARLRAAERDIVHKAMLLEGGSPKAAANRLGMPYSTFMRRLHVARAKR